MENLDLFPELLSQALKPERAKPRVLMHVRDAGEREDGEAIFIMACKRCGNQTSWIQLKPLKARRGILCPTCAGSTVT